MNQRDYFIIGCKLLGIWCFILFLSHFFRVLPSFFITMDISDDVAHVYRISRLFDIIKAATLFGLGVYLLAYGRFFHKIAFPDVDNMQGSNVVEKLRIAFKILGMYIIVIYIPDFLSVLSNYLIYSNSPKYMDMTEMTDYVISNALPTIGALILGFYLLKSSKIFVRLSSEYSERKDSSNDTDQMA